MREYLMKNQKETLLKAATLGLTLGMTATPLVGGEMPKAGTKYTRCFGINTCKGANACSVKNSEIKAANKALKKAYKNSKAMTCSSNSACGVHSGHLAWLAQPDQGACFKAGGFIFERNKDGKIILRDKNGVKGA
jgi:hypothetical protein